MRPYDPLLDLITDGSYLYRSRVRLDRVGITGDGRRLDIIEGRYRVDAARIPQAELTCRAYLDDEPDIDELLQVSDTRVNVAIICRGYDLGPEVTVDLDPLWLQQISYSTDDRGTRVDLRAVDILGRLSENGLTGPVQPGGTVKAAVTQLLNTSGHTETVTVTGPNGPNVAADVYDGDGAMAASEIAEAGGYMLRTTGINDVALVDVPAITAPAHVLDNVTRYTLVTSRAPTKLRVQRQSTDGTPDSAQTAGGSGGARYGTVTRTVTRPVTGSAAGLLRRTRGMRTRLTDIEALPFPPLVWGDTVKIKHDGAPDAVVWAIDLPLHADAMRLTMRTPEVE